MSRFVVSPVAGNIARFVVNSEKVIGLVKTHSDETLITIKVDGQIPIMYRVKEKFEELAAKMKDCFIRRAIVTPVEHNKFSKFMLSSEKVVGLFETVQGETILSFKPFEFDHPKRVVIEESIEVVLASFE